MPRRFARDLAPKVNFSGTVSVRGLA